MPSFEHDTQAFSKWLVGEGVIGFFDEPVTFKSGKQSFWYVNGRVVSQTVKRLTYASAAVIDHYRDSALSQHSIDAFVGVPEGALLLGSAIQRYAIADGLIEDRLYQVRSKPKEHGAPVDRFWVTGLKPGRVIIVEDTTTTGGSALALAEKLRESGTDVMGIIALVNRLQCDAEGKTVKENMATAGIPYVSLTDASHVLPLALAELPKNQQEEMKEVILKEYQADYGDRKLPFQL